MAAKLMPKDRLTLIEFTKQNFSSFNDNTKTALSFINHPGHALVMNGYIKVEVGRPDFLSCIEEKELFIVTEEHLSLENNYLYFRESHNSAKGIYYRISDGKTTIPAGFNIFFPGDIVMVNEEVGGSVSYSLLRKPYWFIKEKTGKITGPFSSDNEASRHMQNEYMDWESIVFDENQMTYYGGILKDFIYLKPIR